MEQPRRIPFGRIVLMLAIAIAVLGAALLFLAPRPAAEVPPLAGAPIGGPFALTDQRGQRFTHDALKGRYALIYFGYTYCPDVCPVDVDRLARGLKAFEASDAERAATVQPVFVSVDPARDTVAVVRQFVAAFHPRLVGLTGTEAEVAAAKRAWRVYSAKAAGTDDKNYLVDHTAFIYLMDPDGKPIMHFERGDSADAIAAGLDKWVA